MTDLKLKNGAVITIADMEPDSPLRGLNGPLPECAHYPKVKLKVTTTDGSVIMMCDDCLWETARQLVIEAGQ